METIKGGKFDVDTEVGKAICTTLTNLGSKLDQYLELCIADLIEEREDRKSRRGRYNRVMELKTQIEELRLSKIIEALRSEKPNGADVDTEELFKNVGESLEKDSPDRDRF